MIQSLRSALLRHKSLVLLALVVVGACMMLGAGPLHADPTGAGQCLLTASVCVFAAVAAVVAFFRLVGGAPRAPRRRLGAPHRVRRPDRAARAAGPQLAQLCLLRV